MLCFIFFAKGKKLHPFISRVTSRFAFFYSPLCSLIQNKFFTKLKTIYRILQHLFVKQFRFRYRNRLSFTVGIVIEKERIYGHSVHLFTVINEQSISYSVLADCLAVLKVRHSFYIHSMEIL